MVRFEDSATSATPSLRPSNLTQKLNFTELISLKSASPGSFGTCIFHHLIRFGEFRMFFYGGMATRLRTADYFGGLHFRFSFSPLSVGHRLIRFPVHFRSEVELLR